MTAAEILTRLHNMCICAACNGMFNIRIEVHADCHHDKYALKRPWS